MQHIIDHLRKEKTLGFIYLSGFFLSLYYAFIVYINSSFLETFFSDKMVGILYALGAICNMAILLNISRILRSLGNTRTMIYFLLLVMTAMFSLTLSKNALSVGISFVAFQALAGLLWFHLDIFLQTELKGPSHVGGARGIFLTLSNIAFVLSPTLVGFILTDSNYRDVYLYSFFFLAVVLVIITNQFQKFEDPHYPTMHTKLALSHFMENRNLFHIYITSFILQFFYTVMVIYTPFYLHHTIGFSWATIGQIFSVMLLPFVLIEVPGGLLADHEGEKTLLILGLILTAVSTASLPFLGANVMLWTIMLFATRCGAALVEIMSEAYFFKHVKGRDSNIIGFFRTTGPLAYIVTPIVSAIFILIFPIKYLFILTAIIVLCGIKYAREIKDTV